MIKNFTFLFIAIFFFTFAIKAQNVQFTADVTSGCAPLQVTFTNTSPLYMDTTGVKFYWYFNNNDYVEVFDSTYTYYAGYYNVYLNAFDQFGSFIGSYNMNISVQGNPGFFDISTGHNVCPGENIHFSGYGGSWNQLWDFGDGSTSNYWDAYHTYSNPGTYNVMLIADNSCGRDTTIEQIVVSDAATPEVQIYTNGGEFCANDVITFVSRYKSENYLWDFGDGTFSANPNPEHSYTLDGNYTVKLTVTNSCGMSNSTTNIIHITTGLTPFSDFGFWPNPACPNQEINFNIWNAGTCQWDLGDGFTSTSRNFYHAYADTGTYVIELILTNACGNSTTTYRDISVQYQPGNKPGAYMYFQNFNNWDNNGPVDTITICTNAIVQFRNASAGSDLIYNWSFGDGATSTLENPEYAYVSPGLYEVHLVVINDCGGADTAYKWINVDSNIMPSASLNIMPSVICTGESVLFFDDRYDSQNNYIYSIWFGDGDSLVNFTTNTDTVFQGLASHVYDFAGSYDAIIKVANACGNVITSNFTIIVDNTGTVPANYFVTNSTSQDNFSPNQSNDWSIPTADPNYQLTFDVSFDQWQQGMNDKMYLICWYGGMSIFQGNMGQPSSIVELDASTVNNLTLFAPVNGMDSVVIAGIWYCDQPFQGDPDAYGILGAFKLQAGADTTIAPPGLVISNWSGTCDPVQSGNNPRSACIGDNVEFIVVGGESYEWHFGDGATATGFYATHAYADTGFYDAFVKITNTCGTVDTVHTLVEIGNYNVPQNGNMSIDGRWTCANSPVTFWYNSDNGGDNNYNYLWSFGDGEFSTEQNPVHYYSNSGEFIINLEVSNGCGSVNVTDTVHISSSGFEFYVSNGCYGQNNGYIEQINMNYNSNITYNWSNGQTTESIYNLTPGDYSVTITGSDFCTFIHTYTIVANSQIDIAFNVTNESCPGNNDGQAEAVITGGDTPYYYFWFDGSESAAVQNLMPGAYDITVLDANACSATNSVEILAAVPLTTSITSTDAKCYGGIDGTIDLTVNGGVQPYSYFWTEGYTTEDITDAHAGNYSVDVTDANGCTISDNVTINHPNDIIMGFSITNAACGMSDGAINLTISGGTSPYQFNWSNGQTTEDLSALGAGFYFITLTDANGCTKNNTYSVINPGAPSIDNINITYVTCNGDGDGAIALMISGGVAPYYFVWSTTETTQDISSLTGGNYSVTVTDAASCQVINPEINVYEPQVLTSTENITNISCFGLTDGSIELNPNGGNGLNNYTWSNASTSEFITNLSAGTYFYTITDEKGCSYSSSAFITEPTDFNYTIEPFAANCFGEASGSINLTVSGATSPYSFSWSNSETTEDINNLLAGSYGVTIIDANNCSVSSIGGVSEPSAISPSIFGDDVLCNGGSTGNIYMSVTGGTSSYTFMWSNGATTQSQLSVPAALYVVTITDANNCNMIDSFEVFEPEFLYATAIVSGITCNGANDGSFDASFYGGVTPYSVLWSNGSTTEDIFNLAPGYYSGTLTDANGCTFSGGDTIYEPAVLVLSPSKEDNRCYGDIDGTVYANPAGGTAPYSYTWSAGGNSNSVINLPAGDYYVTVTDANGCIENDSVTVITPDSIAITSVVTDASTNVSLDGAIDLTISGGTSSGAYSYIWNTGEMVQDISNLIWGTYYVTVSDDNGCEATSTFFVDFNNTVQSINETSDAFSIYPNPAQGIFTIESNKDVSIKIFNSLGELIYISSEKVMRETIDFSLMPKGLYIVNVQTEYGKAVSKQLVIR